MFVLQYTVGHDRVDKTYQTVGGFVNVGLQLENLLKGESPFTMPEPIFRSPRSLRHMLTEKVKRDWHQPAAMVLARSSSNISSSCSLQGSVFIPTPPTIIGSAHNTTSPLIPLIAPGTTVTICWCGALVDTPSVVFQFSDGTGPIYKTAPFTMTQGGGCFQGPAIPIGFGVGFGNSILLEGGSNLNFAPGGGISIQFP